MQYVCFSNKHLVLASKLCVYFLHLRLVRPICCLDTCSFPVDFWFSCDKLRCKPALLMKFKKPKQITSSSSFLVLSLHRQLSMFSYFPLLEACLNANSRDPPATCHGATSVIMRCLGLHMHTCEHTCAHVMAGIPHLPALLLCVHWAGSGC